MLIAAHLSPAHSLYVTSFMRLKLFGEPFLRGILASVYVTILMPLRLVLIVVPLWPAHSQYVTLFDFSSTAYSLALAPRSQGVCSLV